MEFAIGNQRLRPINSIQYNTSASRIVVPDSARGGSKMMVIIAVSSLKLFYKAVFFALFAVALCVLNQF
jgi:hypothetical protein